MKLILASNSPRRRELLSQLDYEFVVIPSQYEEKTNAAAPCATAKEFACHKALDVYARYPDCCVIGCDTVVDLDGTALGKPKDKADAVNMLSSLSGRTHEVHTGVCVICPAGVWLFGDTSQVKFHRLTDKQIEEYVASGSPFDKAGGYGIQDSGFVSEITGSYTNVMGFPVEKTSAILQEIFSKK